MEAWKAASVATLATVAGFGLSWGRMYYGMGERGKARRAGGRMRRGRMDGGWKVECARAMVEKLSVVSRGYKRLWIKGLEENRSVRA